MSSKRVARTIVSSDDEETTVVTKKSKGDGNGVAELLTGKAFAELFCEKWQILNNIKPTVTISDLVCDVPYDVNFFRHYTYRNTDNEVVQNIQIDLENHTFLPTFRVRNFVLREYFGLDEHGKKISGKATLFKQYIKEDILQVSNVVMTITKQDVNGKTYLNCNFTVKEDEK